MRSLYHLILDTIWFGELLSFSLRNSILLFYEHIVVFVETIFFNFAITYSTNFTSLKQVNILTDVTCVLKVCLFYFSNGNITSLWSSLPFFGISFRWDDNLADFK